VSARSSDFSSPPDLRDIRMVLRREDLRFSPESSESVRVSRECIRQHLQGIIALERRVTRSPYLAHAALANQGGDFIRAHASAGTNGHLRGILRHEVDCAVDDGERFTPSRYSSSPAVVQRPK
jgi:hypothetical protein